MSDEIKPCPFCGKTASIRKDKIKSLEAKLENELAASRAKRMELAKSLKEKDNQIEILIKEVNEKQEKIDLLTGVKK